jgi:hypothetical protein
VDPARTGTTADTDHGAAFARPGARPPGLVWEEVGSGFIMLDHAGVL